MTRSQTFLICSTIYAAVLIQLEGASKIAFILSTLLSALTILSALFPNLED